MEEDLYSSAADGDAASLRRILGGNPDLNVNWVNDGEHGWTALHTASFNGHLAVVELLLSRPDIEVNQKSSGGHTAFLVACGKGQADCARLLLNDPRVLVNEADDDGCTPLSEAALCDHVEIIQWLIASGRDLDLVDTGDEETNAIEAARKQGKDEIVRLLERFRDDEVQTRGEVRVELGLAGTLQSLLMILWMSIPLLFLPCRGGGYHQ